MNYFKTELKISNKLVYFHNVDISNHSTNVHVFTPFPTDDTVALNVGTL